MSSTIDPMSGVPSLQTRRSSKAGGTPSRRARPVARLSANGEPLLWLSGGALAICCMMVVGLLLLVFAQGVLTFWPAPLVRIETLDGKAILGEVTRTETYNPEDRWMASLPADSVVRARERLAENDGEATRWLLRTGNYRLTQEHFTWVSDFMVASETRPDWVVILELQSWGRFYGTPTELRIGDEVVSGDIETLWERFEIEHGKARARFHVRKALERNELGDISRTEEAARLRIRAEELSYGRDSAEYRDAVSAYAEVQAWSETESEAVRARIRAINEENRRVQLTVETASGQKETHQLSDIVRGYPANQLSFFESIGVYLSRWVEFLTDEPREANSEGGIFPALFGTVLMTLLMSIVVVPFGVLAALYMREYAKGGMVVSAVRIAVNNLAGVPSIVFGVFGVGFFCYVVGVQIDELLFAEKLPNPTYGTGGLLWASLTLALLTLPVVIVATEEALAAVPRSMREGSFACGASKWQTIRRIILPRAMPGIMTGMILAMARGAGEVAPLMLIGVVKSAPVLPVDGTFPYLHPERSFMHLGFHIYDQGFQSQNSEASKPMVFTTTLLLIAVIAILNLTAVWLRTRLRRRFASAQF